MISRTVTTAQARPTPRWRHAARQVMIANLQRAGWFWGGFVIVVCGGLFTVSRFTDVTVSGVQFGYHAALWFQFSIAISVIVIYLPVLVAAGTTRRSAFRGILVAEAATSAGYAAVITTFLLVEESVYRSLGWFHGSEDVAFLSVLHAGVWPYAWGGAALFAAATLSGLIVGATYYRWGGLRGTVTLPLTLSPLILVSIYALNPTSQWTPWDFGPEFGGMWQPLLALGLLILGALALHRILARVPIR